MREMVGWLTGTPRLVSSSAICIWVKRFLSDRTSRVGLSVTMPVFYSREYKNQYPRAWKLDAALFAPKDCRMANKVLSFRESLTAAARLIPELVNGDGKINLTAVARYCERKGHPISQPTLHRHFVGTTKARRVDDRTAKALSAVFHIPVRIWKGEPLTDYEEQALSKGSLEDLLLAQKIAALPAKVRANLLNQIEDAHDTQEKLKRALIDGNVTQIPRSRG